MYFTVEEENLICLYHKSDRRRTAAAVRAAMPDISYERSAGRGGCLASASGALYS